MKNKGNDRSGLSTDRQRAGTSSSTKASPLFISLRIGLRWGGLLSAIFASAAMRGQVDEPAPSVEWREEYWGEFWPGFGTIYDWDGGIYNYVPRVPQPPGTQLIAQDESGEDWHYAHTNLYSGGTQIGYVAVGYLGYQNWDFQDPGFCWGTSIYAGGGAPSDPYWTELENHQHRRSPQRGAIARFDMDGELVWIKPFLPGAFYGVIQDHDGNIVAVGEGGSNREFPDMQATSIRYNPNDPADLDISDPLMIDCDDLGFFSAKMTVFKVDLNGNVLWCSMVGADENWDQAWNHRGIAQDVTEVNQGGNWSYYVAGWSGGAGFSGNKGVLVQLGTNGTYLSKHEYGPTDPAFGSIFPVAPDQIRLFAIEHGGTVAAPTLAISGHARYNTAPIWELAYCMQLDLSSGTPYVPNYFVSTNTLPNHNTSLLQHTTGIGYAVVGGSPRIIFPTLADYTPGTDIFAGPSIANFVVHLLDPTTSTVEWTKDLGEVRAYDLQAEAIQMTDGNIAVVSSKWHENPFGWNQLTPDEQQCLLDNYSPGGIDWSSAMGEYTYWNTDAYVAKLRITDGSKIWDTQFDSDPDPDLERECFPGNFKKQECMYKITEADDGGLVVSGNTSRNFDDNYLVKLNGCQSRADYSVFHSFSDFNPGAEEYVTYTGEVWDTDMNVHGIIRIPAGKTLTITSGATIGFADSKQLEYPTRIEVEPGGKLVVEDDAKLTSIATCPNSQWDGVLNKGTDESQDTPNHEDQGWVLLREGAIIENARVGIACNNQFVDGDVLSASQLQFAGGGVIEATDANFRNNVRDVVMGPYENHAPGDPGDMRVNRSRFALCHFSTEADLADASRKPLDRVTLFGVRGINFKGCDWHNNNSHANYTDVTDLGRGIYAINSTFSVVAHCASIQPYGTPCPSADLTRSTFAGLNYAIDATTFDLSRTFVVDQADLLQNVHGIRMEGIQDAGITRCYFLVPESDLPLSVRPYGMYLDQCTGYEIEENAFSATQLEGLKKVGLVIKDSGEDPNLYYNNSFDNFFAANIIEGNNANLIDQSEGLEVGCNDFGQAYKNNIDVALMGDNVQVRKTQGHGGTDPDGPAGNRFSTAHDGTFDLEEDWLVELLATYVEYFHHTPGGSDRTRPDYHNSSELATTDVFFPWPGKDLACPSDLAQGHTRSAMRQRSSQEKEEFNAAQEEYDATKDNGDSYSLVGYVGDPSHTSAQVRNALQSVAPNASIDAFKAAFGRDPAMNPWHITFALLSNSPLQSEVLRIVDESGLPALYLSLVHNAQGGSSNILSILEAEMAFHAGNRGMALSDLGRGSWLDSLDVNAALDSLRSWHEDFPASNTDLTLCGVLAAKALFEDLEELAGFEGLIGSSPELFDLIARFAVAQQGAGWASISSTDQAFLNDLRSERGTQGSAQASAWVRALGADPLDEIILLPLESRGMKASHGDPTQRNWAETMVIDAYPNPTNGATYLVYEVPDENAVVELRIEDLSGRRINVIPVNASRGLVELQTADLSDGFYLVELKLNGLVIGTVRLSVQR